MNILFLSDNFPPEVNAPAIRTFEHCKEWVKLGHNITVVTSAPNFPRGKLIGGYKNKLWQTENIDGIRVVRVWTFISPNEGFGLRIIDYISFMISSFLASFFIRKIDLVIGTSPQFFTVISAYLISKYKRIPWVFELRDLWPESIRAVGAMKNERLLRYLERLEVYLYKKADLIICVTESFKKNLINRNINSNKIHVITNGINLEDFNLVKKNLDLINEHRWDDKIIVGYIGTHGLAHSLETILLAAKIIQEKKVLNNFIFVFIGDGAKKEYLVKKAQDLKLKNVKFIDTVARSEITKYWSILDISIIHLKNTPLFQQVIPSKLFEAMGMGVPILIGVRGESRRIVLKEKVGLDFMSEDENSLVETLVKFNRNSHFMKECSRNGLKAAKKYCRKALSSKMIKLIETEVFKRRKI